MIDPVSRSAAPLAATSPAASGRQAGAEPEARGAPPAETPARASPAAEPLSLDVEQGADGVFVYTLSDPGTGTILAVIPREHVRQGRDGRNLDRRV